MASTTFVSEDETKAVQAALLKIPEYRQEVRAFNMAVREELERRSSVLRAMVDDEYREQAKKFIGG